MSTLPSPKKVLDQQERAQVLALRRLSLTPLQICQQLDWDSLVYLSAVRAFCMTLPRSLSPGVGAGVPVPGPDRASTRAKRGAL